MIAFLVSLALCWLALFCWLTIVDILSEPLKQPWQKNAKLASIGAFFIATAAYLVQTVDLGMILGAVAIGGALLFLDQRWIKRRQ